MTTINEASKLDNLASKMSVDYLLFYKKILSTVQPMRSLAGYMPGDNYSPTGIFNGNGGESPINCLYRALGLPAIREDIASIDESSGYRLSYDDTINYHSKNSFVDADAILSAAISRELSFPSEKTGTIVATNDAIRRGYAAMTDPIQIDGSLVLLANSTDGNAIRKPSIFPLVVLGDVPVFPIARRTAAIFNSGDQIVNGTRLPRTFIESVIYDKIFGSNDSNPSQENAVLLLSAVTSALRTALKMAALQYAKALKQIRDEYNNVLYIPAIRAGVDPTKKTGYLDITYDELVAAVGQLVTIEPRTVTELRELDAQIAEEEKILFSVPTVKRSQVEKSLRDIKGVDSQVVPDLFISDILDVATASSNSLKKKREQIEAKISQSRALMESLRSTVDVLSGESIGFGVFDLLSIFIAIYESSAADLIGLLNEQAKNRLKNQTEFAQVSFDFASVPDLSTSLDKLEKKVQQCLAEAQQSYLAGK